MTLKIRKTKIVPLTKCRECNERIFSGESGITLVYGELYIDKWNFHADCFPGFREKVQKVNVFTVKE